MRAALAISMGLAAPAALAQTGTGSAAVYTCDAVTSCDATGACIDGTHRMFVIESFYSGQDEGPTYFAGPLQRSGAGLFFEQQILPARNIGALPDLLTRFPAIMGDTLYIHDRGVTEGTQYYVIRPGSFFPDLDGDRVVTEFACAQELFQ